MRAPVPEGLPAGYKLRHNDIARLLRLLLATAPADRGPCAAVQEWDDAELVEMLEDVDDVHVFSVDCTVQRELCRSHNVRGWPEFQYSTDELHDQWTKYTGARDIESLKDFVNKQWPHTELRQ